MAQKRMFSLDIVDTDKFLDMPLSTQALYFHLGMRADDDGFVGSPRKITNLIGAAPDDMKILISKGFVIPFESGVCVITDWKVNNHIQKDRYKPTIYADEMETLELSRNGKYVFRIQNGSNLDPQVRSDQVSIDQYSTVQHQTVKPKTAKTDDVVVSEPIHISESNSGTAKKRRLKPTAPDVFCLSFITELSDADKLSILKATDNDVVNIQVTYEMAKQQGNIDSLTAWIIHMVGKLQRGEVNPPVGIKRQTANRFNNSSLKHNYDFDELERLERERLKGGF